MDELSRTQRIIEKFFESDKPMELGMLALKPDHHDSDRTDRDKADTELYETCAEAKQP